MEKFYGLVPLSERYRSSVGVKQSYCDPLPTKKCDLSEFKLLLERVEDGGADDEDGAIDEEDGATDDGESTDGSDNEDEVALGDPLMSDAESLDSGEAEEEDEDGNITT